MKKLLLTTLAILLSLTLFGRPRELNPLVIDKHVTDWVLDQLRDAGYTVLPEVIVQDTLNKNKQKFSSRYETKGGRGMMMPHWAVDSTWSPGDKPKSNYEKYWEAREDSIDKSRSHVDKGQANRPFGGIHFVPGTKDNNVAVNEQENNVNYVEVDNYYDNDPFYYSHNIGMYYHGGFNYWMYDNPYYYSNFYWGFGYNPYWYTPWYFGYNNWYNPYYYGGYPYYGGAYSYPSYNNHSAGRASYGALGSNHFTSYGNSYSSSSRYQDVSRRKSAGPMAQQSRPEYSKSNRSYTPSYETPRMSTRPAYNNSRVNNGVSQSRNMNSTFNRSTQTRTPQQGTRSFSQQNQSRNQTRSYSAPTNRSYSAPATNYNSGSVERRSSNSSYSSGGNFNSGSSGVSRSSSGGGSTGGSSSSGSMGSSHSSGRR